MLVGSERAVVAPAVRLGHALLHWIEELQGLVILSAKGLASLTRRPLYRTDIAEQIEYAGADTFPIVAVLSLFIGMALTLQIAAQLAIMGMETMSGVVVGIAIISEIGPVITAIVFAGRSGAGMASELASMVLRNQVDMLRVFGIDPVKKLVTPRIVAAIVMVPCLTILGDFVALAGGAYVISAIVNQSAAIYWRAVSDTLILRYVLPGVLKPFVFGAQVAAIACYEGLSAHGGARGIKQSTTRTFVLSSLCIIVTDFIITRFTLAVTQ
jgi:phospholipid/cholesterol/gamma-HCH transport system permease protein